MGPTAKPRRAAGNRNLRASRSRSALGIEIGPHAAMDDGDDQHASVIRAIEDHMPRVLVPAQAQPDLVGGASHQAMVRQQVEDAFKLVRVSVGLSYAELLGGVEVDFAQVPVGLPGEPAALYSGRPRSLAITRASATISLTPRELMPLASASSR